MQICESHDDCVVVYEGKHCPVCDLEKEKNSLVEEKNDTIEDLRKSIDELNEENEALQQQWNEHNCNNYAAQPEFGASQK